MREAIREREGLGLLGRVRHDNCEMLGCHTMFGVKRSSRREYEVSEESSKRPFTGKGCSATELTTR